MITSSTKSSKYLRSVTISDVHLHHPRTPTQLIVDNLTQRLFNNHEVTQADIFWISGDLFDRLLTVADPDLKPIVHFICRLLYFCEKYSIALRVLEGTGSHDYHQSLLIKELIDNSNYNVDFKYFDKLTIEYEEKFDLHVLYVPDELNHDASITWHQVKALCQAKGIEQVDYAIMHGFFDFQLPEHVNQTGAHMSSRYRELVKRYVLIGHHHLHRIFQDFVIVPGSFDRLAHNEEGPKGYILIDDYVDRANIRFIENTGAKIYRTLTLRGLSLEESLKRLDGELECLPAGSAVQIKADKKDPIAGAMDLVRNRYAKFVFTSQFEKEDTVSVRLEEVMLEYNPIQITKENLVDLVSGRIDQKSVTPAVKRLAIELLEAVL